MPFQPSAKPSWPEWLRVAAAWLAAALVMQALQGAMAIGAGPLHSHDTSRAAPVGGHTHSGFERHQHAPDDASVQLESTRESLDAAGLALTWALAFMAFGHTLPRLWGAGTVRHAARGCTWTSWIPQPPQRPPRRV